MFSKLFEELPCSVSPKFTPEQLRDDNGLAQALVGLVNLHSGEVVELDRRRTQWWLREVQAPGSASAQEFLNPQFYCVEGGHYVRHPEEDAFDCQFGRSTLNLIEVAMERQAIQEDKAMNTGDPAAYKPD